MRTLSIMAFLSLLALWGVYINLNAKRSDGINNIHLDQASDEKSQSDNESLLQTNKRRDLDKIGSVINEDNVQLDQDTKEQIKNARKTFDNGQNLKEKQAFLEQSFLDRSSSIKDIKRIQEEIIDMKLKLKVEPTNTEKWDPKFVYYLMIQENYTYHEVNQIKSLAENGLNPEEINYITELIKEQEFTDRILAFKSQGEISRTVASLKKKPKEKDDFIDNPNDDGTTLESKLIEMNYNQEEKEEMVYGNEQK